MLRTMEVKGIASLRDAYAYLYLTFNEQGGRGVELADAIDHIGAALRSLGVDIEIIDKEV